MRNNKTDKTNFSEYLGALKLIQELQQALLNKQVSGNKIKTTKMKTKLIEWANENYLHCQHIYMTNLQLKEHTKELQMQCHLQQVLSTIKAQLIDFLVVLAPKNGDKGAVDKDVFTINNYVLEKILVSAFMKPLQGEAKKHTCKELKLEPVFVAQLSKIINDHDNAKLCEVQIEVFMSIHDYRFLQQRANKTDGTATYLKDSSNYLAVTAHVLDNNGNDFQVVPIKIKSQVTPNTFCNARGHIIVNLGLAAFETNNIVFTFLDADNKNKIQCWVPKMP